MAGRLDPASTVAILRQTVTECREDRVPGLAAEVAFFALLGLAPSLLALAAALGSVDPLLGADAAAEAEDALVDALSGVLGGSGAVEELRGLFEGPSPGALTLGAAFALFSASRGFLGVINALDVAYEIPERRSYLRLRLTALAFAVSSVLLGALILLVLVIGPLLGGGRELADLFGMGDTFTTLWSWARWPVVVVAVGLWTTTVLHIAPNHEERTPWRWDVPGGVLATVWALGASAGFRVYLAVAGGASNAVIGTLGGAVAVVTWLWVMGIGLLVGGELNSVLARRWRPEPRAQARAATSRASSPHGPSVAGSRSQSMPAK